MLAVLLKLPQTDRWTRHFPKWFSPFQACFACQNQRFWIITDSPWSTVALEQLQNIADRAQSMLGGNNAVLIVDDICLSKFGSSSVRVGGQYSGQAGKITNCQCLVSLTLARDELRIPLRLKLFLPSVWSAYPERCNQAGVPKEHPGSLTKWEITLQEIDNLPDSVQFGMVLADAGYGVNASFRRGLSQRGLRWSVGTIRSQRVYPEQVYLIPVPKHFRGRPQKHPTTSEETKTIETVLERAPWHRVTWRQGTEGPLSRLFSAKYVRLADRNENARGQHLPGEGAWVVGEQRARGERKYCLCNLPRETTFLELIQATKQR